MPMAEFLLQVGFGLVLMLLGRKLFWVYVALLGFLFGMETAQQYVVTTNEWLPIGIGLIAGLICALLAMFLQYAAVGVAGFVGGAYLAMNLLGMSSMDYTALMPLLVVLGAGAIGLALFLVVFDPALILLSSAAGAALIVQAFVLERPVDFYVFSALTVLGVLFQLVVLAKSEQPSRS